MVSLALVAPAIAFPVLSGMGGRYPAARLRCQLWAMSYNSTHGCDEGLRAVMVRTVPDFDRITSDEVVAPPVRHSARR